MLSLSAATRGFISQSLFGRALSSPETPHQVLKQKPKTTQNIDNDDDNFHFHASCVILTPGPWRFPTQILGSSC